MSNRSTPTLTYAFAMDKGLVVMPQYEHLTLGARTGVDPLALIEARRAVAAPFVLEQLSPTEFDRQLSETYARSDIDGGEAEAALAEHDDLASLVNGIPQTADLLDGDDDAPVIRLINGLIFEAVRRRASDIHIDPHENKLTIRYRIDGLLQEILTPARRLASPLVSRIKVMARLDIAEKRMPQDGRISLSMGGRSIDVRVATLPSRYGERVTMRLLDTSNALLGLTELGMDETTLARYRQVLAEPNGIILITGPTGSGKTTTLYASLTLLNNGKLNLMTLEDPVEYGLEGITQTQMNDKVGLTFAATLRSILRHDPDVIMVGEIRDIETAKVAHEFALTGRLALSTVHTNSAAGAITRLRDMGIEPFLLSATMRAVIAQRLVRRLCSSCKEAYEPDAADLDAMQLPAGTQATFYRPKGCITCGSSGYTGRIAVYELLIVDKEIKGLIHDDASETALERAAFRDHDMLFENGRRYVLSGETSPEEVIRVCRREARADGRI